MTSSVDRGRQNADLSVLDDLERISQLDSEDVLGAVERFAEQCREAWEVAQWARSLPEAEGIESIVVLGMGGSGVSGDVVRSVVEPRLPVPFRTIKSYGPIPEWVGRNSLVFAVSYSGSTEETAAALEEVHERGARAVTISSGGPLADMAERYALAHVGIPGGLQPRASLGYLTLPILSVLAQMGIITRMDADVEQLIEVASDITERCHRKRGLDENPAKKLAASIAGRVAVIYGGEGIGATAAYRFKCDLNEYGKSPAFHHVVPELNHNEIVGWNKLQSLTSEHFVNILLRDTEEHERIALRFDIARSLIDRQFAEVVEVRAEGRDPLPRVMSLILLTQLAAIYVGLAHEIDPGPVQVITKLKNELASR